MGKNMITQTELQQDYDYHPIKKQSYFFVRIQQIN